MAGYYDPRDGRLRVVEGAGTGTRVLEEMILAHELTHALEDQRFGLETTPATDDRTLARSALLRGERHGAHVRLRRASTSRAEETLGGLLSSAFEDTGDLPPFIQAQLLFAYVGGEAFISELLRARRLGAGRHRLRGPPAVLDRAGPAPGRLLRGRRAEAGADPRACSAATGTRAAAGTWGELQTRELLGRRRARAAAGWGGDRYELWRRGDDAALVMRWRWDTPRDEAEFAARLREVMGDRGVVVRRGGTVTLALAPDRDLAERLAGA